MERSFHFGLSDVRSVLTRLLRPILFAAGISGPEQRSTETSSGGGESVRVLGKPMGQRPLAKPWANAQVYPHLMDVPSEFVSVERCS